MKITTGPPLPPDDNFRGQRRTLAELAAPNYRLRRLFLVFIVSYILPAQACFSGYVDDRGCKNGSWMMV